MKGVDDVAAGQNSPEFGIQGTVNPNSASLRVMSVPLYGVVDPQVRASKDLAGVSADFELEMSGGKPNNALVAWQDDPSAQGRFVSDQAQERTRQGCCRGNDARVRSRPAARWIC